MEDIIPGERKATGKASLLRFRSFWFSSISVSGLLRRPGSGTPQAVSVLCRYLELLAAPILLMISFMSLP